jgi:hypothetical protein
MDIETYREYVGNPHVHTVYSDGVATHKQVAAEAEKAGLDFVITSDHNVRPVGLEGYYGNVLLLTGEEVHNVRRHPQANHLLTYGTQREMAPYSFGGTRTLLKAVQEHQGFAYIAHPIEKPGRVRKGLDPIPWTVWPADRIRGLELWNYMSEFKGLLWNPVSALIYAMAPGLGIRGPYRATLRLWDELLSQGRRISVIGGSDAHGETYRWGPIERQLFPYAHLFQCVNTHVLCRKSMTGDLASDRAGLYEALRSGRTWVGYDRPHSTRGFRFTIRSGSEQAVPGQELKRLSAITIDIHIPAPGRIHLLRDGEVIKRTVGQELTHTSVEPGIYRVEVYRRYRAHRVGWIFSSPIYVY